MIEPHTMDRLAEEIRACVIRDEGLLEEMLSDARNLKTSTRRIQPRSATAISLVGTDGGNNKLSFDPFLMQIIRVVDSSDNEYCLEVITPSTEFASLDERHFDSSKRGLSPLGRMAVALGLTRLQDLSPVFRDNEDRSASWVQVYREMTEWAVLLDLVRTRDFGTDTVIVCDGFLRSKMFKKGLFGTYGDLLQSAVDAQFKKSRRRIYIVGIAKHNKILQKYRLAMALEGVLRTAYPAYVAVPESLQTKVYNWEESATGGAAGERFNAGKMFFAKFGNSPYAPLWALDVLKSQESDAPTVFGYLLADCSDGFPVPYYPQCLQRAHEKAALVDFDLDILQDQISSALRETLGNRNQVVDELALQEADPSARRYQ